VFFPTIPTVDATSVIAVCARPLPTASLALPVLVLAAWIVRDPHTHQHRSPALALVLPAPPPNPLPHLHLLWAPDIRPSLPSLPSNFSKISAEDLSLTPRCTPDHRFRHILPMALP